MRIIALEEAFLHPALRELYPASYLKSLDVLKGRLFDVGPERIRRMDAAGIDLQVLSHIQPGVQMLDRDTAIRVSREVNDWLGGIVRGYPTRFGGFAMLPTQSPEDAADELERTVEQFGFKGALINGHTNGRYMDDLSFSPLFERAQALDVPIYIHPTDPPQAIKNVYYTDYDPALTVGWGLASRDRNTSPPADGGRSIRPISAPQDYSRTHGRAYPLRPSANQHRSHPRQLAPRRPVEGFSVRRPKGDATKCFLLHEAKRLHHDQRRL